LHYTVEIIARRTAACLREVPAMMREDKIDLLLVDQVCREGSTIAEELRIPYVVLCNALMLHFEPDVPPFCTAWRYKPSLWRRLRNRAFDRLLHRIARPLRAPINERRRRLGLPELLGYTESQGPSAQISQQPAAFDFPRKQLPPNFHYVGPAIDDTTRDCVDFPFNKLDGRPLVYASLGTLQNRLAPVFATIAKACESLPVQLVLSLGGGCEPGALPPLAGDPILVEFAPQLALLKKAKLCITHAGLNTTLESLANAVPMVAIPITNDQPGVAARIAHSGAGQFIPLKKLTPQRLRSALQAVLTDPTHAANAKRLQAAIQASGGPRRAADVIEGALTILRS
jgi:zeaxanthin glucosyltransferase